MTTVTQVELWSQGTRCELWLNDIPVARAMGAGPTVLSTPAEHLLVAGVNELSLVLDPALPLSRSAHPKRRWSPPTAPVLGRVSRFALGGMVGDAPLETYAEISVDLRPDESGVARSRFALPDSRPAWAWQSASRLVPGDVLVDEVVRVAAAVRDALLFGNVEYLLDLTAIRTAEFAAALPGRSPDVLRDSFAQWIRRNPARPTWDMEPIDPSRVDLRLCAGGRLVECLDLDGNHLVRSTPQEHGVSLPYPLLLGRHEGRLVCLR